MSYAYLFTTRYGRLILTDERSKIGYCYPRFFIENVRDNEYINIDLSIGQAFSQSKSDFESWIDGTEVKDKNFADVVNNYELTLSGLLAIASEFLKCDISELKQDLNISYVTTRNKVDEYILNELQSIADMRDITVDALIDKYCYEKLDSGDYTGIQNPMYWAWYSLQLEFNTNRRILCKNNTAIIYNTNIYDDYFGDLKCKHCNPTKLIGNGNISDLFDNTTFDTSIDFSSFSIQDEMKYKNLFYLCNFNADLTLDLDTIYSEHGNNIFYSCNFNNCNIDIDYIKTVNSIFAYCTFTNCILRIRSTSREWKDKIDRCTFKGDCKIVFICDLVGDVRDVFYCCKFENYPPITIEEMNNYYKIPMEDKIKQDLSKYFTENNITDINDGINTLKSLLTTNILLKNHISEDTHDCVLAWFALQLKNETPLRYHKSADYGEFIYNSKCYHTELLQSGNIFEYNTSSYAVPVIPYGFKTDDANKVKVDDYFVFKNEHIMIEHSFYNLLFKSCSLIKEDF